MEAQETIGIPDGVTMNQQFTNKINAILSTRGFSLEDFKVKQLPISGKTDDDDNDIFIEIHYLYSDSQHFSSYMTHKLDIFEIEYSPGAYLTKESKRVGSILDFLHSIEEWIEILRLELQSSPLARQITQNEEKIKEVQNLIEEKFKVDNNSFFSKEEGNELKTKLDELEKLFKEKIEITEEDEPSLKKENKQLHDEIEMLKEQVTYLSKKKWATALAVKLMNWTSRNPAAAKQIGQAGLKVLLPQEIEESISSLLPEPQNKE